MLLLPGHYTVMGQITPCRDTAPGADTQTLQQDRAACAVSAPRAHGHRDLTITDRERGLPYADPLSDITAL